MARVLYIDDCHRDRTFASIALRARGHEFADAADGEDALEHAGHFNPDCIVVNPSIAVINGDTLIQRLIMLAPRARIVVIGCGLRPQTIQAVLDSGAAACLSRPFSIDQLIDAIEGTPRNKKLDAA